MSENRCVCCGEIIPEGTMVCCNCEQHAPNEHGCFGALLSKKDVRDYRISCATAPTEFPKEFELKMPKVKFQGSVGSCVAHAIATTVEYFNGLQENDNEEMSVGYIYGNRTNTDHIGTGMYTREAIAVTCKYGDVNNELFPYNEEVPEIIEKFNVASTELFEKGEPNRFTSYYRLYTDNEIKTSLMKNGPVIFAMPWYEDTKIVNGVIITSQNSNAGYHCMVIYGWDERGWKIQNSWSEYWANEGRAILPYDVKISEAWGIIDKLTKSDIKIVKPYNSKIGKLFAKIINIIYRLCDALKDIKITVVK